MQTYQLDDAVQDEDFLKGKTVSGKVVLKENHELIRRDDVLVVVLSNGKKFKGRVRNIQLFGMGQHIIGEIEIVRVQNN